MTLRDLQEKKRNKVGKRGKVGVKKREYSAKIGHKKGEKNDKKEDEKYMKNRL